MQSETLRCIIHLQGFSNKRQRRDFNFGKCRRANEVVCLGC
jgi:hypothetical protein